jgi:hypothetical protein
MEALGVGSNIAARSLSSLDMRFSAAVKLPCDNGEGLVGRTTGFDAGVVAAWEGKGDVVAARDGLEAERADSWVTEDEEESWRLWGRAAEGIVLA